jgi:ring-1,2-phenylacetyl-CoA epoxidase subunit PaaD
MTESLDPTDTIAALRQLLENVCDPEIPILTIRDLGILRNVRLDADAVTVVITPTYSGCPAMHAIADDIKRTLRAAGYAEVRIETQIAPAWTTDWLSERGRAKLLEVGIAPPLGSPADKRSLTGAVSRVLCPLCRSPETEQISEFGSTACKALYRCRSCLEPFDYFKCL